MMTLTKHSAAAKKRILACLVASTCLMAGTAVTKELTNKAKKPTTRYQAIGAASQVNINRYVKSVDIPAVSTSTEQADDCDNDPAPRCYNIPLSADLQEYTRMKCVDYGIEEHYELVLAMMWQESNFNPSIISRTDDYGIMQINKFNHKWLAETLGTTNFLDARQNIEAGIYMISGLLVKYQNEHKALMAYNMGEGGARRHWAAGTYTSSYSRNIVTKCKAIKADNYNAD